MRRPVLALGLAASVLAVMLGAFLALDAWRSHRDADEHAAIDAADAKPAFLPYTGYVPKHPVWFTPEIPQFIWEEPPAAWTIVSFDPSLIDALRSYEGGFLVPLSSEQVRFLTSDWIYDRGVYFADRQELHYFVHEIAQRQGFRIKEDLRIHQMEPVLVAAPIDPLEIAMYIGTSAEPLVRRELSGKGGDGALLVSAVRARSEGFSFFAIPNHNDIGTAGSTLACGVYLRDLDALRRLVQSTPSRSAQAITWRGVSPFLGAPGPDEPDWFAYVASTGLE